MMLRILVGALAVALCVPSVVGESSAAGARSLPMQFEWWQEGPAEVCGTQCRTWISAVGTITAETPHEFAQFARGQDLRGALLVLDSGGGSVHGAMALGRHVRRHGMTTMVGKTAELAANPKSVKPRAKLSSNADCESMCAFVLLGGTKRVVPRGARLLVHQIWLGDRRDDAAAATYSAEDVVLVQRDIGRLAQYTIEMGGSIDFLELSLRIPPWEPMRVLARDEIRRMHVDTGPDMNAPSAEAAVTLASSPALTSGARRVTDAAARAWVFAERSGQTTLTRSHPLTVEGEEIGSFDLTLSCGRTAEMVDVGYSERRQASGEAATPLKSVTLSLGSQSELLQVSGPVRAHGTVAVSFIRPFTESANRTLVVSTVSANDARTTIRVGNSGVGSAFARLQQSCGSRPLHAGNARTGQAAAR